MQLVEVNGVKKFREYASLSSMIDDWKLFIEHLNIESMIEHHTHFLNLILNPRLSFNLILNLYPVPGPKFSLKQLFKPKLSSKFL